jgi:propionyl-CoA synthetase
MTEFAHSGGYADFYRRSLEDRDGFWSEQAALIDWQTPFTQVCDYREPPFAKWFVGGRTNLCHNAVDRHLADRGTQNALIFVSTETQEERVYTFAQLHAEVQRMAAILLAQGVSQGDRVLVYMPMIPEAAFAMLACARIGAIHSVVFGGFASHALASRIDDAEPVLVVSADAGSRGGKVVPYKPLLDEAITLAAHKPARVLMVDRGLATFTVVEGRDVDYTLARAEQRDTVVPCAWLDATHPSYTLYTSGTTGKPKGVQRDTGGYAVALAASMKYIFCGQRGETYFSTSDIGWAVGHSYVVYGPLIAGMATILYEGLPIRPDAAIWWSLVEKYRVTVMFSAPTAIRVLKKHDPEALSRHDLSSLRALFLAGEPLDEPTAKWISTALGKPIIDNYWQTETGWPISPSATAWSPRPASSARPARRCTATTSSSSTRSPAKSSRGRTRKAWSPSPAPCRPVACRPCGATMPASSRPTGPPSRASSSTRPSTGASATRTATTSSSAAWTTSSTSPVTGWARARSKRALRVTRTSPRWPWWAWPTR